MLGSEHIRVEDPVHPRSEAPQVMLYSRLVAGPEYPTAAHVYVIGVLGLFGFVGGFAVRDPHVGVTTIFTFAGSLLFVGFVSPGFDTVAIFE